MKAKISALMDGELVDTELTEPLRALRDGGEALQAWREYHLISDALRDTQILSSGFSARFAARLALEPTVLAPASIAQRVEKRRQWVALSAAASFGAVALVGWLAFAPQPGFGPGAPQITQSNPPGAGVAATSQVVPMSREANDYLLAHQNYSPRSSLQGVAPYVRTVSESARPR